MHYNQIDYYILLFEYVSRNVRKRTFGHVRPEKIPISLRIRAVWSESLLGAFWITKYAKFLHAENGDWSDYVDAKADLSSLGARVVSWLIYSLKYLRAYARGREGSCSVKH